jgi:hypothetical protein
MPSHTRALATCHSPPLTHQHLLRWRSRSRSLRPSCTACRVWSRVRRFVKNVITAGDGSDGSPPPSRASTASSISGREIALAGTAGRADKLRALRQNTEDRNKKAPEMFVRTNMPVHLQHLLDVDGDGQVDEEEHKMYQKLLKVTGVDLDGDGRVDQQELLLAKQLAGRSILARRFVGRQKGKMWRFGPQFLKRSGDEVVDMLTGSKNFSHDLNSLKVREFKMNLAASNGVTKCLGHSRYSNCNPLPAPTWCQVAAQAGRPRAPASSVQRPWGDWPKEPAASLPVWANSRVPQGGSATWYGR